MWSMIAGKGEKNLKNTDITTPPPTPQMVHDRNETGTSVLDLSLASIPVNKRKAVKEATADLVDPLMPK